MQLEAGEITCQAVANQLAVKPLRLPLKVVLQIKIWTEVSVKMMRSPVMQKNNSSSRKHKINSSTTKITMATTTKSKMRVVAEVMVNENAQLAF